MNCLRANRRMRVLVLDCHCAESSTGVVLTRMAAVNCLRGQFRNSARTATSSHSHSHSAVDKALAFVLLLGCLVTCPNPLLIIVSPDSESNLPACCRRDGKHRCAASFRPVPESKGFGTQRQHCPLFPQATAAPGNGSGTLPISFLLHAPVATTVQGKIETETTSHRPIDRSHLKRGPPFTISQSSLS